MYDIRSSLTTLAAQLCFLLLRGRYSVRQMALLWTLAAHPVTILVAQGLHVAIIAGFTSPNSFWRLATLPFQFLTIWLHIVESRRVTRCTMIQGMVTGIAVTYPLDYIDRVLLQRWSFEAGGPTVIFEGRADPPEAMKSNGQAIKKQGKRRTSVQNTFWARFKFGLHATTSRRQLGTPYEAKNSPHFSERDPTYVPSRSVFLRTSIWTVLACYAFLDINDAVSRYNQLPSHLFTPDKFPLFSRLGDVTLEELVTRLTVPPMIALTSYCMILMTYNALAIVAVGLGITGVESWRPIFGSVRDLYTLRNFWGKVWHQYYRHLFTHPAEMIVHKVLRLPDKGVVPRYTKQAVAVFVSGVSHMFVDLANGLSYAESHSIYFFTVQALGVMFEDAVQEWWKRAFGGVATESSNARSELWKRVVGALWVWMSMALTVPPWIYGFILRRAMLQELPLMGQFSLCNWLIDRL